MSAEGARPTTARDVLPPSRRGKRTAPAAPLPTVVMVSRPDRDARSWADLALASASELEESLLDEQSAHAATREALAAERAKAAAALARALSAEAALTEVRAREADHTQALDRALGERWRLEEELASLSSQASAIDAHRAQAVRDLVAIQAAQGALEAAVAERDGRLVELTAQLERSNSAVLHEVGRRNRALHDNQLLIERCDDLLAQLERVREALR